MTTTTITANPFDFSNLLTGAVAIVPIVVALVQVFKMMGLPSKFAPIVSIGAGVVVAFLLKHDTANLTQTILEGVLYGLSASGLYSGLQTTMSATPNKTTAGAVPTNPTAATVTNQETATQTVTQTKKDTP